MNRFDPRGILAVLSVVAAFALQFLISWDCHLGNGSPCQEIPPWVVGLVSSIVAFYFGYKAGNGKPVDPRGPDDPRRPYDPEEDNKPHPWDPPLAKKEEQ